MADTPMHEIEQCPACGQTRCTPNPDELRALRESHDAKDAARFEWLTNMLDFDVTVSEADPCDWADENVSIADAWRKAIDHAMAAEIQHGLTPAPRFGQCKHVDARAALAKAEALGAVGAQG